MDEALLAELSEWIAIPSISADPDRAGEVVQAGEWLCERIREAGGEAELADWDGHPLVLGLVRASSGADSAPTVLCYGHFDVQPPAPLDLWESEPFEAEIRGEWLYGRGVADDKGQLYLLVKAAQELAAAGALPVNLRFACDGEEEVGGSTIVRYLEAGEHGAAACVIFDSGYERRGLPAFSVGTRGLLDFQLRVRAGERDLHSGMYGNAALNAIHALFQALGGVLPRDGRLPDPLRAGIAEPTDEEQAAWAEQPAGDDVLSGAGAAYYDPCAAEEFYRRTTAEPSVDVNGVIGGKPGLRNTTIPAVAEANFTVRLAPGQDPEAIAPEVERLLKEAAPASADVELTLNNYSAPGLVDPRSPAVQLGLEAFERALGTRPLLVRSGGTLPIVAALAEEGIPTVLTGISLPESNIHSPNERILVEHVPLGIAAARELFTAWGRL
jgi:acetylornithine deacetylase/succinyl-diaminopimelate desuccinylase-like protein